MAVNGFGAITWPHIGETVLKNEDQKGAIEWHAKNMCDKVAGALRHL